MHFFHILQLLALLTLANGTPIVAKKIFGPRFSFPVDAGTIFLDGRPLLGHRKPSAVFLFQSSSRRQARRLSVWT
jgi:hypothetical protein